MGRSCYLLPLGMILVAVPALAMAGQTPVAEQVRPGSISFSTSSQLAPQDAGPVAVPEPGEQAVRYYRSGNVLWFVNTIWRLLVPAVILFTGVSARLRNAARRIGRKWILVIGVYFGLFIGIEFVISLPLAFYQEFLRQHAYGLSNQTFGKWFGDSAKSLLVVVAFGAVFLWVPYAVIKRSPRRWWLYTGFMVVPFLFFMMLVAPVWIDPLFNDFGEMKDKSLEAEIYALADRAGIGGGRVYEVNKSVDTKALNAYVTGFMNTKRIVLWDTIIARLAEKELLSVMAHEMGHYVLNHVIKGILFFSSLILVGLYGVHRVAGPMIGRFKERFGFSRLSDVASLPLLLLLLEAFSLVLIPGALAFSRHIEREADRFGLELVQTNRAAATAFVALQEENLGYPRPGMLYTLWRASHPSLADRIEFCNEYQPWEQGEPLRYGRFFR